jgi:hypothetical protein
MSSPSSSPSAASCSPDGHFDPQAPFTGSDGLEYECLADKILDRPKNCWRNARIAEWRREGTPEADIRAWVRAYDGTDPRFDNALRYHAAVRRVAETRHAARAGAARDLQAAFDPFHAAD